jgi:hypothetical protein
LTHVSWLALPNYKRPLSVNFRYAKSGSNNI